MSTTIDNKVVEAKFDNKQFESAMGTTLSSLDKLKNALHLDHASKGLEEVSHAASKMNLSSLGDAAEGVGKKFSAMSIAGATAIATLANKVVNAGLNMAKSFSIAPISAGFGEYETKIGSIQTILANTQKFGTKLPEVTKNLNELNTYADKTIYSFGDMTKNIGLFTNAGIRVGDATSMIKGFSNAAAASGTNAEGAAGAAYQLSQALSSGTIRLMDWRSLTNVGMGNANMKSGIIDIATAMGKLKKGSEESNLANKDFNRSLESGWLSADVMSQYLKIMAGDMDDAKMKSLGLSEAQIKTFKLQQKTAQEAATKVRTFTQLVGTIKESVGSGWAQTFELLLGNFDEASVLFTNINKAVGDFVGRSTDARYKLIHDWRMLHGRGILIKDIGEAFKGVGQIVKAVSGAFKEIFPPKTGKDLLALTKGFGDFISRLKMGEDTVNNLKRTFAGIFAVFDIAKQVISGVVGAVVDLFNAFAPKGAGGSLLAHTAAIGDIIVYYDKLLKTSNGVEDFFNNLDKVFAKPIAVIDRFRDALGKLTGSLDFSFFDKLGAGADRVHERFSPLEKLINGIGAAFKALGPVFDKVGQVMGNAFSAIGGQIKKAFSAESFSHFLDVVNTVLLGGVFLLIKKFIGQSSRHLGGFTDTIKSTFNAVTDTLTAMQAKIKAQAILAIAGALALLVASIVVLAMIDPGDIAKSLGALAIGMIILTKGMDALTSSIGPLQSMKLPFIAAGIMGIAAALLLLSIAVKIMATMEFADMLRGLTGLAIGLVIIQKTMERMPKNMIGQATALLILGAALVGIALAIKVFATIAWDVLGHGLAAMGGALVVIAAGMRAMPKGMIGQAVALNLLATAMAGMAGALVLLGSIPWDVMGHGLTALAGSLVIIAVAMRMMPQNMLLQSVALNAVATSMVVLSVALKLMGGMSWTEIGKGLVTLAGAMLILAIGLNAMSGTLGGAAALTVAAIALALLTPVLITLGSLDWTTIIKSLVALAAIFTVLGVAGLVLTPIVPVLLGLALAMVGVGAGLALMGAGALAFAMAFAVVVATGTAGIAMIQSIIQTVVQSIPITLKAVGEGLVVLIKTIGVAAPGLVKAFAAIVASMLDSIILNVPKMGKAFLAIVMTILNVIITAAPRVGQAFLVLLRTGLLVLINAVPMMAAAGLKMFLGLLNAVNNNISRIIPVTVAIIVKFMKGISDGLPKIIAAGVEMIISFVNGLAKAIDEHSTEMGEAGGRLAVAIVKGIAKGLAAGGGVIADAAKDLAKHALDGAKNFLGIHSPSKEFEKVGKFVNEGFAKGLTGSKDQVQAAYDEVKDLLSNAMKAATDDVTKAQAKLTAANAARANDIKAIAKQRRDNAFAEEKAQARLDKLRATKNDNSDFVLAEEKAQARLTKLRQAKEKDAAAIAIAEKSLAKLRSDNAAKNKDNSDIVMAEKTLAKVRQDGIDKLAKLTAARDKDANAIRTATAAITEAKGELARLGSGHSELTKNLLDEKDQLQGLSDEYEAFNEKIKDANKALEDAIKTRDDYNHAIQGQYSDLPDISEDTTLTGYLDELQSKAYDVQAFATALQQLRQYGLSDQMYQEFLKQGVDALPFVQELVKGGTASVDAIDEMAGELAFQAVLLGESASSALYQAGVDSAQGIVAGLESQQGAIAAQIQAIGALMVNTLKQSLGIKSPSRIFAELGRYTVEGMAGGMTAYSGLVSDAATETGKEAVRALRATLSGLSDAVDTNLDLSPRITPVLDLSSIQKGAKMIDPLLKVSKIQVGSTYSKAKEVSDQYAANREAALASVARPVEQPTNLSFTQINNSPKALSQAEIYRKTNNQISQAKGALTRSASKAGSS